LSVPLQVHRTFLEDAFRRFAQNRLALIGLVLVLLIIFFAVFAHFLAPFSYEKARFDRVLLMPFQHPEHPLGTDEVGRDYLSRLIYGARTSLIVSLSVQGISLLIGLPVGAIAGYFGGKFDYVICRVIDIMTAFPALLFTILIISVLGGGLGTIVIALSLTSWIIIARITRAQVLSLRELEYCIAARSIGASEWRILMRHLLPNAMSPILIAVSFGIPAVIFAEAGLSFLGLGVNDPIASWGKMVGVSNAYIRVYWHLALFPTLAIAITMLGFSFLGDGLRDALDPKQKIQK
jgi:ABC-type dipeptide/oligopeptide/nickel transport system permease subunit|tara:strand:+ start:790 stop:1665 length:876 start_codon:yes stop_codon:yes gene_type:complete